MNDFPALSGLKLIKAVGALGFVDMRQKGGHHYLKHSDGRCIVVPVHSSETIGRGLLSQILRDYKITIEELREAL